MSEATHPSSLALERALRNELVGSTSAEHKAHIDACAECRAKLDEMRQVGLAFLASPEARVVRQALRPRRTRWQWIAAPALVAAAAFVVYLQTNDVTVKGAGVLAVRRSGGFAQAYWKSGSSGYIVLVAVDREGAVTLLHPENGTVAVAVAAGREEALGRSVQVDEALAETRFVAFFSPTPFALEPLLASLRATGRPPKDFAVEEAEAKP